MHDSIIVTHTDYLEKDIDIYFENIASVHLKQDEQKKQGLNDYNIFTTLLNVGDEVRLHSRFLYSLLNPKGMHYQGPFFLENFLKQLRLPQDFILDFESVNIFREDDNIDLYITDGIHNIIIENKIYAGDQKEQIERYIKGIYKRNPEVTGDKILVVYLSLDRDKPSDYGLGTYRVNGDWLISTNDKNIQSKVHYRSLNYHDNKSNYSIERMIALSIEKLHKNDNNQNIIITLKQYIEVIKKLYKKYEGKVMTFENYLIDGSVPKKKELYMAMQFSRELINIQASLLVKFFDNIKQLIEDKGLICVNDFLDNSRHVYTKDKCKEWLQSGKSNRQYIGIFFDFGDRNFLFHIQLASKNLHIGIVNSEKNNEKYTLHLNKEFMFEKSFKFPFMFRNWTNFKWFSKDLNVFDFAKQEYLDLCIDTTESVFFNRDIKPVISNLLLNAK